MNSPARKVTAAMPVRIFEDMPSPIGRLRLISRGEHLVGIWFEHGRDAARGDDSLVPGTSPAIERTRTQLEQYFRGERRDFDLPLAPQGTEFQQKVWQCLLRIPYGVTTTYGALAGELGNPNASRAVGLANGSNPIPIVIPCHRVIGANGALTGFGGGLPTKSALLALERAQRQPDLF
jgi:methylated-DNA-[protein]-cysteine S-methyltransferase